MIYIRKIFRQDLRNGKQIAFPKEPSNLFFNFSYNPADPDRQINFRFNEDDTASPNYSFNGNVINTRLYAASSESRIDSQLKQFLKDSLNAQIDDIIVFSRKRSDTSFEFKFIPQTAADYSFFNLLLNNSNHEVSLIQDSAIEKDTDIEAVQKIYYGAPGTGKSHELDELIKSKNVPEEHVFRTTFHPEFTYSDFIGQLLPTVKENENGGKEISYTYNKGVFTQALEKAYEKSSNNIYLILEEMSRGDVAAIFGDTFQLLDRNKSGAEFGYSRYSINNDIISKDIHTLSNNKVKLPPNLSIFGTVNTSDQNVFVMDTAFKRRFEWQYISTKPVEDSDNGGYINNPIIKLPSTTASIKWVDFYLALNKFISSSDYLDLGEDKQIGQFFIEFPEDNDDVAISDSIKNKLLQYLWSDIHKASFKRDVSLFSESISSFSELYDAFAKGENIFSSEFIKLLNS